MSALVQRLRAAGEKCAAALGGRLRAAREALGLTLYQAEALSGVHWQLIGQYERGGSHPGPANLYRLAVTYRVSVDALLGLPVPALCSATPSLSSGDEQARTQSARQRAAQDQGRPVHRGVRDQDAAGGHSSGAQVADADRHQPERRQEVTLNDLFLQTRTENGLRRAEITTVPELCACTERRLRMIQHFGEKSLADVKRALARHGLSLHGD